MEKTKKDDTIKKLDSQISQVKSEIEKNKDKILMSDVLSLDVWKHLQI